MSWQQLPTEVQETATSCLTHKQLETWKLELDGLGIRPIAWRMEVTPRVISDRLKRTHHLLLRQGIRQDEFGRWHIHTTEAA